MSGDDIAKISESFRIRVAGFETTGLPAVICAIGVAMLAHGFSYLLRNNADAALRGLVFARSPGRAPQPEPKAENWQRTG